MDSIILIISWLYFKLNITQFGVNLPKKHFFEFVIFGNCNIEINVTLRLLKYWDQHHFKPGNFQNYKLKRYRL